MLKRSLPAGMLLLLSLFLPINAAETDNTPLKHVTLQLQWLHQFQFAGYYMAKEKGYYKKAGLSVDIREYRQGMDVVKEVLAGRAEFGVGRSSLITERMRGKPVVALGAIFQNSPHVLLVRADSGIVTARDLKGKRVMITDDASTSASILAMLSNRGITRKDLKIQPHSMDIRDLINRKTDAMASYISNEPFLLESMGVSFRAIKPQDYGFDFYSDIFFTSEQFLDKDPKTARAFYNATIEGWRYAFDHIGETVDLILQKYNTQHKSKAALLYEGRSLKALTYIDGKHVPLGNLDPHKVKRIADIFMVLGHLDKDFSLEGFIYGVHLKRDTDLKLTRAEKIWLSQHPYIRVGIDIGWPPFEYVTEEGEHKGITAEYLHLIEDLLGIKFEVEKNHSWAEVVEKMKARELDIYSCVVKSEERQKYMDFTNPYLSFPMVIISSDSVNFINGLKELEGKRVAVVEGYVTQEILQKNHPKITLIPIKNVEEALRLVAFEKVDAYVGNIATASYYIKKLGFTNIKVAGETPYRFEMSMAGRNDWPMLTPILQKALDAIDEKEKDRIYKEWIAISYEHGFDYSLFWKIMAGVVLLFAVIGFWVRFLQKQIILRKKAETRLNELNRSLEAEVKTKVEQLRQKDRILVQQSKMAAMGEMIGIIAHQLKQPLNAIGLLAQDVKDAYDYKELDEAYLNRFSETIQHNVQYMAGTVDDFRNFFNPNKQKKLFEVKGVIEKSVELLNAQFSKYRIRFEVHGVDAKLFGMSNELQQVLINLANNAKDAFLERDIKERLITIGTRYEGDDEMLLIDFCDTAGGIDEKTMEKIFDAYFSTKGEDGTGIGLHMVRMMIKESFNGEITASNTDTGVCFSIKIPLKRDALREE